VCNLTLPGRQESSVPERLKEGGLRQKFLILGLILIMSAGKPAD
jgi:hypothetical protein